MADEPLFLDDKTIAKKLGLTEGEASAVFTVLERDGFPRRNPLFNDRRFWPSVRSFFEQTESYQIIRRDVRAVPSARSKEKLS